MRSFLLVVLAAALAGCGGGDGAASFNDDTAKELKQKLEQMFKDIDSANFAGLKMWADKDVVLFDFDENNAPVAARGSDSLDKYLAGYDAAMRKGLKIKTTISSEECAGDADVGYCTVEYDQTMGTAPEPFRFRGTLVAAKTKEGWRWVHWHSSFREIPKPAAVAPPPEPVEPTAEAPPAEAAPAPEPPPQP